MKITVWNISSIIVLFILHHFLDSILPGFVPSSAAVAVDFPHAAALVLVVEVEATVAVPVELPAAGGLLDNGSGTDEAEDSVRKQIRRHSVCNERFVVLRVRVGSRFIVQCLYKWHFFLNVVAQNRH